MKKFKDFINEEISVRDAMKPKTSKEIGEKLPFSKSSLETKMKLISRYNLSPEIAAKVFSISTNKALLNYASENNNLDIIKMLVNDRNYNINYALGYCLSSHFYSGVKWCLENGADPFQNIVNNQPSNSDSDEVKLVRKYRRMDIQKSLDKMHKK